MKTRAVGKFATQVQVLFMLVDMMMWLVQQPAGLAVGLTSARDEVRHHRGCDDCIFIYVWGAQHGCMHGWGAGGTRQCEHHVEEVWAT